MNIHGFKSTSESNKSISARKYDWFSKRLYSVNPFRRVKPQLRALRPFLGDQRCWDRTDVEVREAWEEEQKPKEWFY